MAFITSIIASVAGFVASLGSSACFVLVVDEPECPKSLLK